jgi:hypothetical protein
MSVLSDAEAVALAVTRSLKLSTFTASPISRLAVSPAFWEKPGTNTPDALMSYERLGQRTIDALLKMLLLEFHIDPTDQEVCLTRFHSCHVF